MALSAIFVPISAMLDRYRRSVRIKYELQGTPATIAKTLAETFSDIRNCSAVWCVTAKGDTADWKRNAGAQTLQTRKNVKPGYTKPSCIRGNLSVPAFKTIGEELYFLPDAILAVTGGSVAALTYNDLSFSNRNIRFIEESSVPRDSSVIDYTWRFVNKNGGPDRRFNFNKRLPICAYGEMTFSSAGGLHCVIQYSNAAAGQRFSEAIDILKRPETHVTSRSITKLGDAKKWPAQVFALMFICLQGIVTGLALANFRSAAVLPSLAVSPSTNTTAAPTSLPVQRPAQVQAPSQAIPHTSLDIRSVVQPSATTIKQRATSDLKPEISSPPLSIVQCLSIKDVDERVDCLEQAHAQGATPQR